MVGRLDGRTRIALLLLAAALLAAGLLLAALRPSPPASRGAHSDRDVGAELVSARVEASSTPTQKTKSAPHFETSGPGGGALPPCGGGTGRGGQLCRPGSQTDAAIAAPESGLESLDDVPPATLDTAPAARTAAGSDILSSFAGLDRAAIESPGTRSFPPDTNIAVGPARLLEATNKGLRLSARQGAGAAAVATLPLASFFAAPADAGQLYDPKVLFDLDANGQRFWIVAAQTDYERRTSSLYLAYSKGPAPANLAPRQWCRYRFEGAYQGTGPQPPGPTGPGWADYPNLGAGTDAVVLTSNHYRFGDHLFAHALVRVIDKSSAQPGCGALRSWTFQPAADFGDRDVIGLQPVRQVTRPASFPDAERPVYLLSTLRLPAAAYRVWRIANIATGTPTLERVDVAGPAYNRPPAAPQLGSRLLLDTGDARLIQAVGVGNTLWTAHTTICDTGDGVPEACARVVRLQVGAGPNRRGLTARLTEALTLGGGDGVHYWMPTVAANRARQIAVAFLTSSARINLGSAWAWKPAEATAFHPTRRLAEGNCGRVASTRAGDFLGAQVDPVDLRTLWLAGERAWHQGRACNWQTWIARLDPGRR